MKTRRVAETWVTPKPWALVDKRRYGDVESYRRAAAWLWFCRTVADWGGGGGLFRTYLPAAAQYLNVDGTQQLGVDVIADLATYRKASEGILLRHVVDNTPEPWAVLENALASFTKRLVVVTYTPHAAESAVAEYQYGWPVWHLNHGDLRSALGEHFVHSETTAQGAERLYYMERRCAS